MKNKTKFLGIIALAAVIGFSLTGCADSGAGGNSGNTSNTGNTGNPSNTGGAIGGHLGDTLELSGQVYLERENPNGSIRYESYNGNLTVSDRYNYNYYPGYIDNSVSGEITNGQLSYSIGTPSNLSPLDSYIEEEFGDYSNVRASKANVRGHHISYLYTGNSYNHLYRERYTRNIGSNSFSGTYERVEYMYVAEDVTVSGTGETMSETYSYSGFSYSYTYITQNFSLALKAGWNAVYIKSEYAGTFTGTFDDPTSWTETYTATMSLSNPSNLLWVLEDDYYYDYSGSMQESRSLLNAPETGNPDRIRRRRGK